ncbi:MAG: ATP-binding protein [Acidobacteria bacterium]|nr:ATP-binding protein [Acidobacteriota bacterium]
MLARTRHLDRVQWLFQTFPVVALLGPRQVGKTTLARAFAQRFNGPASRFDLENSADVARLGDPLLSLGGLDGLVVLDEIQRLPELFPTLRVLVDRPEGGARFLVLGSASPELLRQTSETLAGRIAYHRLQGFALDEIPVGAEAAELLWLRGGFPRSYLAPGEAESLEWRLAFIQTFLERDLPQLGSRIASETLHRFWSMIAHYHAQRWNGAELARAFGVSESSVRRYLDLLTDSLVLRQLPPWHENLGKRLVKSPKVYVEDSGLLHALLGIEDRESLLRHPKIGASWEGFLIKELIEHLGARREECYFWATHTGAELDLLVMAGDRRFGFEVKRTTAPRLTRSMRSVLADLRLDRLDVLHAGDSTFPLAERVRAVAASRLLEDVEPMRGPSGR